MTRDWTFTLAVANQWYNLWDDLITKDPSFTDPTFSNAPFVPNSVCELKYQNQTLGAVIYVADNKKQTGFSLTSASWDVARSRVNNISLKNVNFKTDTNGTVIYVSLIAN